MASTRFNFNARIVTSSGSPLQYDVTEGSAGSNAGAKQVGVILWDGISQVWYFKSQTVNGVDTNISGDDATQISAFIATLSAPVPNQVGQ